MSAFRSLSCLLLFASVALGDEKAIDAVLHKALKDFDAPGIAVAVVKDDQVVYLKGVGVRDLTSKTPVTPDTVFAIASCSKAFTATAVGCLVEDGRMKWDDPVRKHLPEFRLSDPLADRDVTIRDLLSHRTGVIRHDILWLVNPWSRADMLRHAGFLKPDRSFRSVWGYNNLQYLAAGEASARAAGTTWEQLVRSRLFEPLGMKSSHFSVKDLLAAKDHALPHGPANGEEGPLKVLEPFNLDNMAPAGAITSTVRDLTGWLRCQLNEGVVEGKRVLKAETLRETHSPVIAVAMTTEARKAYEGVTVQQSYGLGWMVYDYRGKRVISHGGSIFGYRSQVTLLPSEKVGIAVLTNLKDTPLPIAVSNSILDLSLKAKETDWNKRQLDAQKQSRAARQKTEADLVKRRKANTKSALPLSSYTGAFEDAAHGRIEIREQGGALKLSWGTHKDLPLPHWHFDTFRVEAPSLYPEAWGDRFLVFRLNGSGEVESFTYLGHEFKRVKARS